ncbi:hypothetical protein ACH42_15015 [Endozoicomonas sp. (ex Bugula neritina AB1)]|nr:hypothetical protein ACH42_15015 [Endozoicomonas sp. (ex Bugula neritina AB1)]
MAKKQSSLGVKAMSAVGLLAVIGVGAYFWSDGGWQVGAASKKTAIEFNKPLYYEMRPLVVNIASGNSKTRYLKIRPTLVTRHQSFFDQLADVEPVVRNHLLSLYTQKTAEELLQSSGFEALREESLDSLQEALKDEAGMMMLSDVLFTEYVIQ